MSAKRSHPRGNILLFGMLLVAFFVTAAIPVSIGVTTALRQSRLNRSAMAAGYLAESGAENAIYALRHTAWEAGRALPDFGLDQSLDGGTIDGTIQTAVSSMTIDIPADDAATIDLMNEDVLGPNGIYSLRVATDSGSNSNGWLVVQWVTWQPGSGWSDTAVTEQLFSPSELQTGGVVSLVGTTGPAYAYRLRLRARYDDIDDLTVSGYATLNGSGASVPLPLITAVEVISRFDTASQRVTVTMPRRAPLYGLFDYAIFSETDLTK